MTLTLALAGHGTTNGHPATGLNYALKFQLDGKQPYEVAGRAQLADDLDEIAVRRAQLDRDAARAVAGRRFAGALADGPDPVSAG